MTTINPSTPFFKWKMAIVTKSTDDWTKWNCEETYERSLFIGIHDDLEKPYAALYLIYKGTVQPAAGNAILADLLALQTTVSNAVQELQSLIAQVNATSASMQELWQKVNVLVVDMEDKLEDMQIQIGKAKAWAEGTDAEVTQLGGTHSSKTWAGIAKQAADLATGAAFPLLEEGDQGKALVVNDACDGYELTTITADAAEYSTNRIVRTAHEQQNWVLKKFRWSQQAYFKAGVVGWVPNGIDPSKPADWDSGDFSGFLFTTCTSKSHCVVQNNIASDSTVTAVQDLAPDDLPLRDYRAHDYFFVVSADGEEVIGFQADEMAQCGMSEHFNDANTPSTFFYVVYCKEGKAFYTKDKGTTWVQCSLPFAYTHSSGYEYLWAWTFGSVISLPGRWASDYGGGDVHSGDRHPYSWLVPPFECCIANGYSEDIGYPGSPARLQAYRFKISKPIAMGTIATRNATVGMLHIYIDGETAGGFTLRFDNADGSRYDLGRNMVNGEDMAICICRGQSEDAWFHLYGFSAGYRPPFGEPPSFFKVAHSTDYPDSAVVRVYPRYTNDYNINALNGCAADSIAMRAQGSALQVFVRTTGGFSADSASDFEGDGSSRWLDISPASAGGENTFTSTNTFKSWTNLEGETRVRNGGYLQGHEAAWFTVPNPSKDKSSEEYPYEAINRGTMTSAIALATTSLEPKNEDASLTPAPSFYGQWTEYTQQTSSGAVTVHVIDKETGLVSGFGANAYCCTTKTLEDLGYDNNANAEIVIRFKSNVADSSEYSLFSCMGSGGSLQNFGMYNGGYGSYAGSNHVFGGTVNANVWTFVRFKMVDGLCTVEYLEDAAEAYTLSTLPATGWTKCPNTANINGFQNGELRLGHNTQDGYEFPGTIDLKNTRIRIGGITVWNGPGLVQPFTGVIETVGSSVILDEATGVASNFNATSYLKFVAPSTGAYSFDFIMRVKTAATGLNPLLAYDSTDGTVAVTDMGLNTGRPYTYQNGQTDLGTTDAVNDGEWAWVRFKKSSSSTDGYVLKDPSGQYTLANLPDISQWDKAPNSGSLEIIENKVLCIGKNFHEDADTATYFHGSIDLYNTKLMVGDAAYYDGSTLVPTAYETQGIHQQSACLVNPNVLVRRFESNGKTYMELDGTFSGTVAADNTITIDAKAYSFKGTLISLQAMPLGTGTVTVNYNSTTAADLENGTITLRTSIAAGETFSVSLHCVIAQGA